MDNFNEIDAAADRTKDFLSVLEQKAYHGEITLYEVLNAAYLRGIVDASNVVSAAFGQPKVVAEDLFAGEISSVKLGEAIAQSFDKNLKGRV